MGVAMVVVVVWGGGHDHTGVAMRLVRLVLPWRQPLGPRRRLRLVLVPSMRTRRGACPRCDAHKAGGWSAATAYPSFQHLVPAGLCDRALSGGSDNSSLPRANSAVYHASYAVIPPAHSPRLFASARGPSLAGVLRLGVI